MSQSTAQISAWRRKAAPLLLAAMLIQVMMFFVGLSVPLNRIRLEWGKIPR